MPPEPFQFSDIVLEELLGENHGALPGRRPGDFIAGTLPYEIKRHDGIWDNVLPPFESQTGPGGDRFNCVTQAHHNIVAMEMMDDIAAGRMPQMHQDWLRRNGYFNKDGKLQFSKQASSIMNGTIPEVGNWLYVVADCANRIFGLIPESMLPSDPKQSVTNFYDKRQITMAMLSLGTEFRKMFRLPYEWIGTDPAEVRKHLKQAPLQLVLPGHSTAEISKEITSPEEYMRYLDSYNPYIRRTKQSNVSDVLKVLTVYNIINQGDSMVFFKVKKADALWQLINGVWVGFADGPAYNRYTAGHDTQVVEIDQAEFDKVARSTEVIKS